MLNSIETIDEIANKIASTSDIVIFTFQGFYELIARTNPTQGGLSEFLVYSNQIVQGNLSDITSTLRDGLHTLLERSLSDSERLHFYSVRDSLKVEETAYEAFGAVFVQAKIEYARSLRNVIGARVFGMDTYNPDPKIMSRNGKRWNFSEYVYLSARQMLIDWYNFVKISYIAEKGFKQFNLLTENKDLIDAVYEVEDYPEIAQTLFHPRTSKLVGQGVMDVQT